MFGKARQENGLSRSNAAASHSCHNLTGVEWFVLEQRLPRRLPGRELVDRDINCSPASYRVLETPVRCIVGGLVK